MKEKIRKSENHSEWTEEVLQPLQKEYMEPRMSPEQLDRLKMRMEEAKLENRRERRRAHRMQWAAAAAAVVIAFIALPNTSPAVAYAMEQIPVLGQLVKVVTFRDYEYNSEKYEADVKVPGLVLEEQAEGEELPGALEETADEINSEIQRIANDLLEDFVNHMRNEMGYRELVVKSEVLMSTRDYFTLKLSCYQGQASGYSWNYFYTIDLNTGKGMKLKDFFQKDADYITPISENIKEQMRKQMKADENVAYWVDRPEDEANFEKITDETSFYINENNNVVISFNEGDAAPMYMGIVEFEIPAEVLEDIRK